MAIPRLDITLRNTQLSIDYLMKHRHDAKVLAATHQHFIAELIMMRMFAILEDAIAEIAYKLVAGATYTNGTSPRRLYTAKSISGSRSAMLSFARPRPRQNLRWSKARYIQESTANVLSTNENYIRYARIHGHALDEMRKVRNFVAHRNSSTRQGFRSIVRATYGANSKIGAGAFLVSENRNPVAKVDEYLATIKIIISDMVRGY